MNINRVRCRIELGHIPPGHVVTALQPQTLFRVERFELGRCEKLFLNRSGVHIPFDGRMHVIESYDRTLAVGNFLCFAFYNGSDQVLSSELWVEGATLDESDPGFFVTTGLFLNELPAFTVATDLEKGSTS